MSDLCPAAGGAAWEARQAEQEGSAPSPGSSPLRDPCSPSLGQSLGLSWHPDTTLYSSESHHQRAACVPSLSWSSIPTGSWVV